MKEKHGLLVGVVLLMVAALLMLWRRNAAAQQALPATSAGSGGMLPSFAGFPISPAIYPAPNTVNNLFNVTPSTNIANFLTEKYMPLFGFVGVGAFGQNGMVN